mmetsp:Transcript_19632/g.43347  ORF Transcript_19632/g.43347 Transcript_19632/m.43347 type:complete len:223 (-) Transcript_19632:566-1234(-)
MLPTAKGPTSLRRENQRRGAVRQLLREDLLVHELKESLGVAVCGLRGHLTCKACFGTILQLALHVIRFQEVDDSEALEVDLEALSEATHTRMTEFPVFQRVLGTIKVLDLSEVVTQVVSSLTASSLRMTNGRYARRLVLSITGLQLVDQDPDDQRVVNQVGASQHGAITFQRLQQRVPLSRGNGQDLSLGQPIFVLLRAFLSTTLPSHHGALEVPSDGETHR